MIRTTLILALITSTASAQSFFTYPTDGGDYNSSGWKVVTEKPAKPPTKTKDLPKPLNGKWREKHSVQVYPWDVVCDAIAIEWPLGHAHETKAGDNDENTHTIELRFYADTDPNNPGDEWSDPKAGVFARADVTASAQTACWSSAGQPMNGLPEEEAYGYGAISMLVDVRAGERSDSLEAGKVVEVYSKTRYAPATIVLLIVEIQVYSTKNWNDSQSKQGNDEALISLHSCEDTSATFRAFGEVKATAHNELMGGGHHIGSGSVSSGDSYARFELESTEVVGQEEAQVEVEVF